MYRNIVIINHESNGVGLSHDPSTGNCVSKEFESGFEYASNGAMAITTHYLQSAIDSGIEKVRFNIVSLDDVAIKAFSIRKLERENGKVNAQQALDFLIQDFHEEEAVEVITDFVHTLLAFDKAGHEVTFRKASDVQKAKSYPGTLTETQQELTQTAWDIVAPKREIKMQSAGESGLF